MLSDIVSAPSKINSVLWFNYFFMSNARVVSLVSVTSIEFNFWKRSSRHGSQNQDYLLGQRSKSYFPVYIGSLYTHWSFDYLFTLFIDPGLI